MSRPGSRPSSRPASQSRSATPKPSPLARASTYAQLGLGPRPEINEEEIKELLDIDEGRGSSIIDYFEYHFAATIRYMDLSCQDLRGFHLVHFLP